MAAAGAPDHAPCPWRESHCLITALYCPVVHACTTSRPPWLIMAGSRGCGDEPNRLRREFGGEGCGHCGPLWTPIVDHCGPFWTHGLCRSSRGGGDVHEILAWTVECKMGRGGGVDDPGVRLSRRTPFACSKDPAVVLGSTCVVGMKSAEMEVSVSFETRRGGGASETKRASFASKAANSTANCSRNAGRSCETSDCTLLFLKERVYYLRFRV